MKNINIEQLIKRIQGDIDFILDSEKDLDSASWIYQEGILITANEAKLILKTMDDMNTQHP